MAQPKNNDDWKKQGYEMEWLVPNKKNCVLPRKGQSVTVHCTGYGKNGDLNKIFWTTRKNEGAKKDEPFTFKIGVKAVISGWDEGVAQMSVGTRSKVKCSPGYAYGAGGFPAWGIMKNSPLIFDIELLSIK
eukprot:28557_1